MPNKFLTPTYEDFIPLDAPKDPATDRPLCRCGRFADKLHCPGCGSFAVYNMASRCDRITDRNGKEVLVPVYKCRRCGGVFNKHTFRISCDAPPSLAMSMKKRREVDAVTERLNALSGPPQARTAMLQELFKNVRVPRPGEPSPLASSDATLAEEPTDEPSK